MNHKCGITPEHITQLNPNQIFVFGSNLAGIHGAGAALAAMKWGAVYGCGVGLCGQTYALPTKSRYFETLPLDKIKLYVEALLHSVLTNIDLHFLITKVGCGLAGLKIEDVAPMFSKFIHLSNCSLPIEFIEFITKQNTKAK